MTDSGIINDSDTFHAVTSSRSKSIKALVAALAKAQGDFVSVRKGNLAKVEPKDGEKQGYTYRYAELADFIDACRVPLAANGLAITQPATTDGRLVAVETTLWHESGEWMSNVFVLESASPTPQKIGSALTFARRYAYCALLGVSAEKDDDDGAAAQQADHSAPRGEPRRDRQQQQRTASSRAPSDTRPNTPPAEPKRRGPKVLERLREDCRRHGLEEELVAVVEAAGGNWTGLPEDCTRLFDEAWSVVGERLTAAKAAALDGAKTHNTPDEVAARVAQVTSSMSMS